jgi:cytochrome c peroxidase
VDFPIFGSVKHVRHLTWGMTGISQVQRGGMNRRGLVGLVVGAMVILGLVGCDTAEPVPDFSTVLNLPSRPYNYANPPLPAHFRAAAVLAMDNTPGDNPTTNVGATLGRVLFYDPQLSRNGTISCASCHRQELGFSDPNPLSVGFQGGQTRRNSPGLANSRFYERGRFFRDERAATLEDQVVMPIQDPIEMGMDMDSLVARLSSHDHYLYLFKEAFGTSEVTGDGISRALAQFVRSIVAFDSPYDEGLSTMGTARVPFPNFTAQENLGKGIFMGRGLCSSCHLKNVPLTDPLGNTAVFFAEPSNIGLDRDGYEADLGLEEETGLVADRSKFKAPSLRNIAITAPYMHDGRMVTLAEVIDHYNEGVLMHPSIDERLVADGAPIRLDLTTEEKAALVAFLATLTDRSMLTDERYSDPFVDSGN